MYTAISMTNVNQWRNTCRLCHGSTSMPRRLIWLIAPRADTLWPRRQ